MRSCRYIYAGLAVLVFGAAVVSGETSVDNPYDDVNAHFAVATKYFGDGVVQLHSREEGEAGARHSVWHIDCINQRADRVFDGAAAPENFPVSALSLPETALEKASKPAPLAQHACKEHGYPPMKW